MGYTLSTLIAELESLKQSQGDLPVFTDFDGMDTRFSNIEVKEASNDEQSDVHGDPKFLPKRIKLW